jgi:hypothetical protein
MARKQTSRRVNKRLDSKKVRSAEDAALRGDHVRTVHTGGWSSGREDRQPPLPDAPVLRGKKKKKKEIGYCPARKHEGEKKRHYYIEKMEEYLPYSWEANPPKSTRKIKVCMYCRHRGPSRYHRRYFW